tara:strand:- start:406 stop:1236 length:831 start_codon:yes stop_codon:yes gene_type:complete
MGVNGGAGNEISFSDLQTFYGGSNPISLSEYYRGGSEVPSEQVTAQANTSGTSDQTIGEFTADVTSTSAFTGTLGSLTVRSTTSYTVTADDGIVGLGGNAGRSDENVSHTWTITRSGSVVFGPQALSSAGAETSSAYIGSVASGSYQAYLKGPAWNSAPTSPLFSTSFQAQAGDVVTPNTSSYARISSQRRASVTTYDVDFTNNSSVTITTTSGSTNGNSSTGSLSFTAGQTRKVKDDASSSSYVLGYDAVNGNTNVPASGTINMDVFNAPGTPTP